MNQQTCPHHPDAVLRHLPALGGPNTVSCPLCFQTTQRPTTYTPKVGAAHGRTTVTYHADGSPASVTVDLAPGFYDEDHAAVFAALVEMTALYAEQTAMSVDCVGGDVLENLDGHF